MGSKNKGLRTYIDLKEQQYRHILEFEVQSFSFDSNRLFRIEELVSYWLDLYSIQSKQGTKYNRYVIDVTY